MSNQVISIVYNTAFYVYKFRINLINELKSQGFRVVVISPHDGYVDVLKSMGIEHHEIGMSQYGMNPVKEMSTVWEIYRAFKHYQPACSLHYTIKPNIFGGLAAAMAGVPVVNNIAGAGRAFSDDRSLFSRFVSCLYRFGLNKSRKVFFQNRDDMALFLDNSIVRADVAERIPGSGVDLNKYAVSLDESSEASFRFLFVGRLLKEKGIQEYLTAAQQVLSFSGARKIFIEIVGELDDTGACIDKNQLQEFLKDPRFVYHGTVSPDKMPELIGRASCVVLPSYYREGVPRSLLEAAAMGKPIVTTDNVGCREVVEEGVNGFKVPVKNVVALHGAMLKMFEMSLHERLQMGLSGRKKMETEFDEAFVLSAYRRTISEIVSE